jgi:hypothetical protein
VAIWRDVLDAIESGTVVDPVVPFDGPQVLAVDMNRDFAAAFSYAWQQGEATMEITVAQYKTGSWIELRTNGPRASCDALWNWHRKDAALLAGYQERLDLGDMHLPVLTASAGICGTAVAAVRASGGEGHETPILKTLPIRSNLGAFIILVEGDSPIDISLLDVDGDVVGEPWPKRRDRGKYD